MTELRAVLHQDRRYWTIHLTKSSRNNISCYFETLKLSKRLYMTFDLRLNQRGVFEIHNKIYMKNISKHKPNANYESLFLPRDIKIYT